MLVGPSVTEAGVHAAAMGSGRQSWRPSPTLSIEALELTLPVSSASWRPSLHLAVSETVQVVTGMQPDTEHPKGRLYAVEDLPKKIIT